MLAISLIILALLNSVDAKKKKGGPGGGGMGGGMGGGISIVSLITLLINIINSIWRQEDVDDLYHSQRRIYSKRGNREDGQGLLVDNVNWWNIGRNSRH